MTPHFTVPAHDIDAAGLARSFELPAAWLALALGDTDVEATGDGHADVRLSKTGHDVIVRGKVRAPLQMPCARCLKDVTIPVDTELSLLLRPHKTEHTHTPGAHGHGHAHSHADKDAAKAAKETTAKDASKDAAPAKPGKDAKSNGVSRKPKKDEEEEYEFSSEEADTDSYDGETVVLDDFIREALLLEVPSFPLCSEDCPGIRPSAKQAAEAKEAGLDPRLSPLKALKTKLMLAAASKDAAAPAPEEDEGESKPAPAKAARPKIHAHRTAGAVAKAKHSPKKKAK
ncbi:MAG: DUF177 domain-containing protein [Polyangiaceae bacterium]